MKRKIILLLVLLLLFLALLPNYSQGQEKNEIASFTPGNKYLNWTEIEKMCYLRGLIDMFFYEASYYDPKLYSSLKATAKDMSIGQIKAIFDKFLEEHPEKWHWSSAGLFWEAMMELMINEK